MAAFQMRARHAAADEDGGACRVRCLKAAFLKWLLRKSANTRKKQL
jgi:hypothetical protein